MKAKHSNIHLIIRNFKGYDEEKQIEAEHQRKIPP